MAGVLITARVACVAMVYAVAPDVTAHNPMLLHSRTLDLAYKAFKRRTRMTVCSS